MSYFPYPVEYYVKLKETWPASGKHILCTHDSRIVILYLATREHFAIKAAAEQSLMGKSGKSLNLIKGIKWFLRPSFSSVIYGSGWATKPNGQRILAIVLSREEFEELLNEAISDQSKRPEVTLSWEPEYNPLFSSQTGRKNLVISLNPGKDLDLIERFNSMVKRIEDVTSFVRRQRKVLLGYNGGLTEIIFPHEEPLELKDKDLEKKIKMLDEGVFKEIKKSTNKNEEEDLSDSDEA